MELADWLSPGIMLSQVWPKSGEKEGETLRALEKVLRFGFFERVQTVGIPYPAERRGIADYVKREGKPLTYTLARVLNDNDLNLSGLDDALRRKSVAKVAEYLDNACEAGASTVALISGPVPGDGNRSRALVQLELSMHEIIVESGKYENLKIVIEPLDIDAHKKNTLGTTPEAVQLCEILAGQGACLSLCMDTAHVLLNRETLIDALRIAKPYLSELHLCNCVTDPAKPFFGDQHIPFGPPGVLGVIEISSLFKAMIQEDIAGGKRLPVFCEVLNQNPDQAMDLVRSCRDILQDTRH